MLLLPSRSTLFPYTTLFRSEPAAGNGSGLSGFTRYFAGIPIALPAPLPAGTAGVAFEIRIEGHTRSTRGERRRQRDRSEEHTSELQSHSELVCRLLLEKKKK